MVKLSFPGATNGVTGCAYLIETDNRKILLEFGLIQGRAEPESANDQPFPFQVRDLDALVMPHARLIRSDSRLNNHLGDIPLSFAFDEIFAVLVGDTLSFDAVLHCSFGEDAIAGCLSRLIADCATAARCGFVAVPRGASYTIKIGATCLPLPPALRFMGAAVLLLHSVDARQSKLHRGVSVRQNRCNELTSPN